MDPSLAITIGILAVAVFVSDTVRPDFVALSIIVLLALTEVLSPAEALAGFADPLEIMIAGLFVVSLALVNTGVASSVGRWPAVLAGGKEGRLLIAVVVARGSVSACMRAPGTARVMLPRVTGQQ